MGYCSWHDFLECKSILDVEGDKAVYAQKHTEWKRWIIFQGMFLFLQKLTYDCIKHIKTFRLFRTTISQDFFISEHKHNFVLMRVIKPEFDKFKH
ncbi:hypothetical protein D3C76_1467110 [compost metagenome]